MVDTMARFSAAEIEAQFDAFFISYQDMEPPAQQVATLNRQQQNYALHWVNVLAQINDEMAYQFAANVTRAFAKMPLETIEKWIVQAMDLYDRKGLMGSVRVLVDIDLFITQYETRLYSLPFEEHAAVLERFVQGLSGRGLKVSVAEHVYTDTETLFVPEILSVLPERDDNFILYKAMVVHQWAQLWFGTWRPNVLEVLSVYPDSHKALTHFHHLERFRLDAHIAQELPGLYRHMQRLNVFFGHTSSGLSDRQQARLLDLHASADDSLQLVAEIYTQTCLPPCCYQGVLLPEKVQDIRDARLEKDKQRFRIALFEVLDEVSEQAEPMRMAARLGTQKIKDDNMPEDFHYVITLDGKPMMVPDALQRTSHSIVQDLGEIPESYLEPAGPGAYPHTLVQEEDSSQVWMGTYHEEGASLYNEWDYKRKHYKKAWCALRELTVTPVYDDFVSRTLKKHHGLIVSLRRTFEALRGEDKMLKRQPDGDTIDVDALVEAYADHHMGRELSQNVFMKRHKVERNIAVLFMVDMSGSTQGWINDAERESLVLLSEALETLGDRYAIYGFSGNTRKRCEVYKIKAFDEPYDDEIKARISGIKAQDYTRMGVAIRHFTRVLLAAEAKIRLLVTLSDGKPDDYDRYRGEYGIEDTRQALVEARRNGIHAFCVTIDEQANEYLPHMYGAAKYVVIDSVDKLPVKVSDIYRKLTT